ncbi:MAG: alanyl-tRNA synthetase [Blastocatellia bacterium]|jgi:alanyl-tRNA synthetase|nr:alanyl-tRNA synthetase [Blastocatellia bacterium]
MPATVRLYYQDSRLLEFDARVISLSELDDGQIAVTLDRTAFYPTGGGQPTDTGMLGDARVVDCIDAEGEGVLHVIQGPAPEVGDIVHAKIDWLRRLDHLQQHTGQHILSAAFVQLFNAPTLSFRVLEHECEIDVELENPTDERIEQAVDLANQIIWESRPISIRQVTSEEAATLPLRKEPAREGELRLIQIGDFDLTPCGGTHAESTGEVGVIAVRSWERARGLTRIHFMAGIRALADYRKANRTARDVAELFSAGREDSPLLVARLVEENKRLRRRVGELEQVACRVEAEDLLRSSSAIVSEGSSPKAHQRISDGTRVIVKVFDDRGADSLKQLALALITHPNTVALLGSRDGDTARLVFARSADAAGDMNTLMRAACSLIDGRGGGKPDLAQGGGKNLEKLGEAIDQAASSLV